MSATGKKFYESEDSSWPILEAKKVLEKIKYSKPNKGFVLFETGYGPSGLPHIGTFGEVVRTSFVRFAFDEMVKYLYDKGTIEEIITSKLFVFSDDFDGMRKIPENVPNPEQLKQYIGLPLTSIPDPFGIHESYGHNMNSRLRAFLDNFNFQYEFYSATEEYKKGTFNKYLKIAAEKERQLLDIMLPTLGAERQETYSPFMPVDPDTGAILAEGVQNIDSNDCTITYITNDKLKEISFLDGGCKLQWKCDFGMRWAALDVDYEIYGKDHYPNEPIYRSICTTLGKEPPINFFYELFLDEEGKKISKSKGNGLTIDQWLRYSCPESLAYYMYIKPRTAKKLSFEIIPKTTDEYQSFAEKFTDDADVANPIWYVRSALPNLTSQYPLKPFARHSLLINLAAACNPEDVHDVWHFLLKYNLEWKPQTSAMQDRLTLGAWNYYIDYVEPNKNYHKPNPQEKEALLALITALSKMHDTAEIGESNIINHIAETIASDKKEGYKKLYQILIGTESGPKLDSLFALMGLERSMLLIKNICS